MKNQVGGMCRSWRWNKFFLDTGPHIFHTGDIKLWNFWKNYSKKSYSRYIQSKNVTGKLYERMIDYPLSLDAINQLPKDLKDKVKIELRNLKVDKKKYQL